MSILLLLWSLVFKYFYLFLYYKNKRVRGHLKTYQSHSPAVPSSPLTSTLVDLPIYFFILILCEEESGEEEEKEKEEEEKKKEETYKPGEGK